MKRKCIFLSVLGLTRTADKKSVFSVWSPPGEFTRRLNMESDSSPVCVETSDFTGAPETRWRACKCVFCYFQ